MPEMAARTTNRGQALSRRTAGRINIHANLDASNAFESRGRFPPLLRVGSWYRIHVVWFIADRSDRKDRLLRGASAASAPELRQAVRWTHERTGVDPLLSVETGVHWTGCSSGGTLTPYLLEVRRQPADLIRADRSPDAPDGRSSRQPRRSATGPSRSSAMRDAAPVDRPRTSAKNSVDYGMRSGNCVGSAISWGRPQLDARGSGDRHDPVRVFRFTSATEAVSRLPRRPGRSASVGRLLRPEPPHRPKSLGWEPPKRPRTAQAISRGAYGAPRAFMPSCAPRDGTSDGSASPGEEPISVGSDAPGRGAAVDRFGRRCLRHGRVRELHRDA